MKPSIVRALLDVLLDEEGQLQHEPQSSIIAPVQAPRQQVAVFRGQGSISSGRVDGGARDDFGAPAGAKMVLGGIEDGDEDADDTVRLDAVSEGRAVGVGEKRAGQVADGSDDHGEVVPTVPEAVVGSLIAEDLGEWLAQVKAWSKRLEQVPASDRQRWKGWGSKRTVLVDWSCS